MLFSGMISSNIAEYKFYLKCQFIIIKGLNKRSRLPRRQTLAVGSFPLARDQLTLGTRG